MKQDKKQKARLTVDIAMTAAMPLLMAEILTGQEFHEWLGIAVTVCFILHHLLNHKWLAGISKGSYNRVRIVITAVNILLLICIIMLCFSGISMSGYVLPRLNLPFQRTVARVCHISFAWWGFILMSVHLGFHWNMIMNTFANFFEKEHCKRIREYLPKVICSALMVLGIISMLRLTIWDYLLFRTGFAYFVDAGTPPLYIIEILAAMIFFVIAGNYLMALLKKGRI